MPRKRVSKGDAQGRGPNGETQRGACCIHAGAEWGCEDINPDTGTPWTHMECKGFRGFGN